MELVKNISKQELNQICDEIGEAFVTNELFHEFGTVDQRKDLVMKYMTACVKCVYKSKLLYRTEDKKAYIGMGYSDQQPLLPKLLLLFRLLRIIPFKTAKRFMHFVKQIENENKIYTQKPYLEILMVCVRKDCQGQGLATKLVDYAKERAQQRCVPLLFDTDMKEYARMYEHLQCVLYHKVTADNGVTRYNLVWLPEGYENI